MLKSLLAGIFRRQERVPEPSRERAKDLARQGRVQDALAEFARLAALSPDDFLLRARYGALLQHAGLADEAIREYAAVLDADPAEPRVMGNLLTLLMERCDWDGVAVLRQRILACMEGDMPAGRSREAWLSQVDPFRMLVLPLSPLCFKEVAVAHARRIQAQAGSPLVRPPVRRGDGRIRIGYVSADFRDHATAHLTLGMYGLHDRTRFEVLAYSIGGPACDAYGQRIAQDCDGFVDITPLQARDAAQRIAADGVDVLVDLKGYTTDSRPELFALRPAPVQAQYLGFPGTMGADFIDYLVCDRMVAPPVHAPHFTERLVYLDGCYQVNDSWQPISNAHVTKAGTGLPESAFVFCCVNQAYKIEPVVFAAWMRILSRVPRSVLWLYSRNAAAEANLRASAVSHGVAPERLLFGGHAAKPEHLARLRLADLFLDTFEVSGHTTASDALWAGVPVLTLPGGSFASRVGASVTAAAGLPDLVVEDMAAYEEAAVRLAGDRSALGGIRERLACNRKDCTLFDTARTVRMLEQAYAGMHERALAGKVPESFSAFP